jgi:hypothetical protein
MPAQHELVEESQPTQPTVHLLRELPLLLGHLRLFLAGITRHRHVEILTQPMDGKTNLGGSSKAAEIRSRGRILVRISVADSFRPRNCFNALRKKICYV